MCTQSRRVKYIIVIVTVTVMVIVIVIAIAIVFVIGVVIAIAIDIVIVIVIVDPTPPQPHGGGLLVGGGPPSDLTHIYICIYVYMYIFTQKDSHILKTTLTRQPHANLLSLFRKRITGYRTDRPTDKHNPQSYIYIYIHIYFPVAIVAQDLVHIVCLPDRFGAPSNASQTTPLDRSCVLSGRTHGIKRFREEPSRSRTCQG